MKKIECIKCKHNWIPRVDNPAQCPKCKGYLNVRPIKKTSERAK